MALGELQGHAACRYPLSKRSTFISFVTLYVFKHLDQHRTDSIESAYCAEGVVWSVCVYVCWSRT